MTIQMEPGIGDINPVAADGVEIEPMALIDTTGSMTWPNGDGGETARKDVLGEAMGIIVEKLAAEDTQAEKEKESGEDAGGLAVVITDGEAIDTDAFADEMRKLGKRA